MSVWIDLVHSFARCPACLTVKVKTLDKNTVIAETSDPYVTFTAQTQLNTFADVQPNNTRRDTSILQTNGIKTTEEKALLVQIQSTHSNLFI